MADAIMRAFVQFRADDTGLKQDAEAKVKAATANLTGTAKLDLDTSQADRKRTELQARLSALGARATEIRINANDKDSLAKIAALQVRLAALDKRTASPKISVEGTARAEAQILALDAQLDRMGKTSVQTRGGLAGLLGEVTGFGSAATAASGKSTLFARSLAAVNLATGVLEPALAGVVVAAGGITAAYAAAGIGLGVFGAVASSVLSQASDAAKNYAKAQEAAAKAENPAQRTAALKAQQQALAGLDASQKQVVTSILAAKDAWSGFTKTATPGVAKVLADAVALLPRAFQLMQPFLAPVETALRNIIAQVKEAIAPGTQFSAIMGDLAKASGPILQQALTAAGNILMGILGVIRAFLPEGMKLSGWIVDATAKFKEWGLTLQSHTGFQSLMTMFREQTPQAMAILKNLGEVILNVGKAMTGLSTFSNSSLILGLLQPLSEILAKLSGNRVLMDIALYVLAIGSAAAKVIPVVRGLGLALEFASANPIVILAAAVVALGVAFYEAWEKSAGFRNLMKDIASGWLAAGQVVLQAVQVLVNGVLGALGLIVHAAATAFGWVPGVGGALKTADTAFANFRASVDDKFTGMIATMQRWRDGLNVNVSTSRDTANKIIADFARQQQASDTSKAALDRYSTAIRQNGVDSAAAKAARDTLVADLAKAGVNANTARTDVSNYTTAVRQNGVDSQAAQGARAKLISDILAASTNARNGRADLATLNDQIRTNGVNSDGARSARAQLITDLRNSGVNADTARRLVSDYSTALSRVPKSVNTSINANASGSGQVVVTVSGQWASGQGNVRFHAAGGGQATAGGIRRYDSGGQVRGPGGPRSDLAGLFALSNKEWVIQASSAEKYGQAAMAALNAGKAAIVHGPGITGMAAGGSVSALTNSITTGLPKVAGYEAQFSSQNLQGALTDMIKAIKDAIAKSGGTGSAAIVNDAMQWLGKIPYVWGGTAVPGGADCSGFVQTIYGRHGISAPRTSEAQGAWVKRTGPVPGGLAFYHSPAGGPDPGHVAIVRSASQVISQGGGMGPTLEGIDSPLWTGVPPGGFARGGRVSRYDTGGWLPPGLSAAYNGTGKPERVVPAAGAGADGLTSRLDRLIAQVERLTAVTAAAPARTGQHVGAAVNGGAAAAAFRVRYPAGGIA